MKFTKFMEQEEGKALWIDDLRPIRKGFDIWAKTYQEAIEAIDNNNITKISFDHDLGPNSKMVAYGEEREATGNDVAKYIEGLAIYLATPPTDRTKEDDVVYKDVETKGPIDWNVHSANPTGEKNIIATMKSAERFWK